MTIENIITKVSEMAGSSSSLDASINLTLVIHRL